MYSPYQLKQIGRDRRSVGRYSANPRLLRFALTIVNAASWAIAMYAAFAVLSAMLTSDANYPWYEFAALWSTFGLVVGIWRASERHFYRHFPAF